MRRLLFLITLVFVTLTACEKFPQLDHTVDSDALAAPYPELAPIDTIKAQEPPARTQPKTAKNIEKRVKALQKRAKRMRRGPVVDKKTRKRMRRGIKPGPE